MGRKLIDLTDRKFGHLTVIKRIEDKIYSSGRKAVQWLCRCDCEDNNEVIVTGDNLKGKNVQSCGCFLSNKNSILHKKYNKYDLTGEYGIGYTFSGEEFWFDLEDYELIKDYCWHTGSGGYITSNEDGNKNYKTVRMHRIIMNCANDYKVDHINHNVRDNRKSNLRIVNNQQNAMNASIRKDNESGVTGVSWDKSTSLWRAYINYQCKRIDLGAYAVFESAVKARKDAEEKYFGEYSYDNSIGKENIKYGS